MPDLAVNIDFAQGWPNHHRADGEVSLMRQAARSLAHSHDTCVHRKTLSRFTAACRFLERGPVVKAGRVKRLAWGQPTSITDAANLF
jgi:hypothetical protein